jgi:hypothetical protein
VGFAVNKVILGQVFSVYFGFPYQLLFHQIFHTHPSSGAGKIGQLVADSPSGHSLNAPHPKEIKGKGSKLGSLLKNNTSDLYCGCAWFEF